MPFGFPDPGLTVAIKATVAIPRLDQPHVVAEFVAARPFNVVPAQPGAERPLPDELTPFKPSADIVAVGPVTLEPMPSGMAIERHCAIQWGDTALRFVVVASGAGRAPLEAPWLRIFAAGETRVVAAATPDPLTVGPNFAEDFDFAVFQAAHPSLRAELLPVNQPLIIAGLDGVTAQRSIELPPYQPVVALDWVTPGEEFEEVPLALDTVTIDFQEGVIDLVWRGNVMSPLEGLMDVDRVLCGFVSREEVESIAEPSALMQVALRELPRGLFHYGLLREDVRDGVVPPALTPEDAEFARYEALDLALAPRMTISLQQHALISAHLIEEREPRAELLKRFGFDDFSWGLEDRALASELSAAPEEDGGVPARYGEYLIQAQESLRTPEEELVTSERYASLVVALERENPQEALKKAQLSLGAWMRIDRRFQARMEADASVAEQIATLIEQERERQGEPVEPEYDDDGRAVGA